MCATASCSPWQADQQQAVTLTDTPRAPVRRAQHDRPLQIHQPNAGRLQMLERGNGAIPLVSPLICLPFAHSPATSSGTYGTRSNCAQYAVDPVAVL